MAKLMFKTNGMVNPKGKPRVYFTCHPDDFDRTFEKVSDDILGISDCAIYFTENMNETISSKEQVADLGWMNLFVIPVTRKLLQQSNRAMNDDFAFAKRSNIPVLPVMFDSGLDAIYSQTDKFGEMQYINPFSSDNTEISYTEKLKKFLNSVLVSDATAKRIRSSFDAYMFLSYRKKDRFYANELMRLIHSNREYRDIAIWYDEYLVPGESFNENISKMLNDSKLFTLLVTPNLLEEPNGLPNFVMEKEYPAAKELGMEIVAAEMENTDKSELSNKFKGLSECVDPRKEVQFRERLIQALTKVSISSNNKAPEHNYLIGLAYRDGIDVEVDRERGLALIKEAADLGWIEASSDLAKMYYYGFFVAKDYVQAASWQKKKIAGLRKEFTINCSAKSRFDLIDALRFYTEILRNSIAGQDVVLELIDFCKEALELCDEIELSDDYISSRFVESRLNTLRALSILYEQARDFDSALNTYQETLKFWNIIARADEETEAENVQIQNKWRIAQVHHDIGMLYSKKGDYKGAINEYEKSLEIYALLSEVTIDFQPNMLEVHNALAQDAVYIDIHKALKHSEIAFEMSKTLYDTNPNMFDLLRAKTLLSMAFVLSESGTTELDKLVSICEESVRIFEVHKDDGSHETTCNLMNSLYKLASAYRRKCSWKNAREYYAKAYDVSKLLLPIANVEDKESVAHLCFDYGTFSVGFSGTSDFSLAIELLNQALELFKDVSVYKPRYQQYVEETESVLNDVKEELGATEPNAIRTGIEGNNSDKIAAIYQFQYFYKKGDAAEKVKNYGKAVMNYHSALEQMEILKNTGEDMGRLAFADIYDRIALCYEMSEEYDGAKEYYLRALLEASCEAKETEGVRVYDVAINYAWKLASFCEEFGEEDEAKKHYAFREFLIEEKSRLGSDDDASDEDFLSPEMKAELLRKLDELDFTSTAFKEGEAEGYSEGLFDDEDGDHTLEALFDTLFGSMDDKCDQEKEDASIITLTDENGVDIKFELVDLIYFSENEYAVLIPYEESEEGIVILKIVNDEDNDVESYLPVEDDDLLSVIFEMFKERNEDRFNFTD